MILNPKKSLGLRLILGSLTFIGMLGILYSMFNFNKASVSVDWSTKSEMDVVGFNILRAISENGQYEKINTEVILSSDNPLAGGDYHYVDKTVTKDKIYYYELEEITSTGLGDQFGPISVKATNLSWLLLAISISLTAFSVITLQKLGLFKYNNSNVLKP